MNTAKFPNPPLDEPIVQTTDTNATVQVLPAKNMRQEIEDVFQKMGGAEGMLTWAQSSTANERLFYSQILPKVIPREVNTNFGDGKGGPAKIVVEWEKPQEPSAAAGILMGAITAVSLSADDE